MFSFTPPHNELALIDQQEREAIVDLLHLCMFADAHISSKESLLLAKDVDKMGWDANQAFNLYESRSIAAARSVRLDDKKRAEFLQDAASRLQSKEVKDLAITTCEEFFQSDGAVKSEAALLEEIRQALC